MVIGNIERFISHLMADVVAGGRKAFVVTNGLPKDVFIERLAMRCSLDAVTDRHGHDALWYLLASNLDRSPDDLAPCRRVLESAGCIAALDRYDLAFDEILDPSIPEWTFDTRNSFGV